jgi:hypothetical protein
MADVEKLIAEGRPQQIGPLLSDLRAVRLRVEDSYMEEVQRVVDTWMQQYGE